MRKIIHGLHLKRLSIRPQILLVLLAIPLAVGGFFVSGEPSGHNPSRTSTRGGPPTNTTREVAGATSASAPESNSPHTPTSSATRPSSSNTTNPPPIGNLARISGKLVFSPSTVTLPTNGYYAYIEISAEGGGELYVPTTSSLGSDVLIYIDHSYPTDQTRPALSKWKIGLKQMDPSSSGQKYLDIKATGPKGEHTGRLLVKWAPIPSFYVVRGALEKVEGETAITYIMHFTLVPNHPHFGNPTIYTRVSSPSYHPSGPSDLCDGGIREKSFVYNGQNEHTLTCIENRPPPYVPGSGSPPPSPIGFSLKLNVYGMLGGEFIDGGTGLSEIGYFIGP